MSTPRLPIFGARPITDAGPKNRYIPKRERIERHAAAMRAASTSLSKREAPGGRGSGAVE